jgi:hypothetical protein
MTAPHQTAQRVRDLIPAWITEDLIKAFSWFVRLRRRDVPTGIRVDVL